METALTQKPVIVGEALDERIRAQDVIDSVTFNDEYFEKTDDTVRVGFWVKSRSGKREEPYGVGLFFKKKEETKNEYAIGEVLHSCPEYTHRLMMKGIMCHHIDAVLGFTKENSEEIKRRYKLRGIKLDAGKYEREPSDVVGIFRIMETKGVKAGKRGDIIRQYKEARKPINL